MVPTLWSARPTPQFAKSLEVRAFEPKQILVTHSLTPSLPRSLAPSFPRFLARSLARSLARATPHQGVALAAGFVASLVRSVRLSENMFGDDYVSRLRTFGGAI